MSKKLKDSTLEFIESVRQLLESGHIKSYTELANALDIPKSMLSGIMHGNVKVPRAKFNKFVELYRTTEVSNPDTKLFEMIVRVDSVCSVLLSAVSEILAHQRGQPVVKMNAELQSMVNDLVDKQLDKF